ncbi:MAG: sigma-70 family RNA polymerase sigma factor [Vicinamibacteraceae bacterium]
MTRFENRRAEFVATIRPFLGAAHRAALRLTRRVDEAKDLTQEAVLRAFKAFDSFTPGTNGKAWLLTITYSVFVNSYRRRQRDPVVAVDNLENIYDSTLGQQPAMPPVAPESGRAIADPEIERALDELPEMFRAAVLLVDVEELSYEEAAAVLQCPVNTVRSRLSRGRKMLWAALHDYAAKSGLLREEDSRQP